MDDHLHATDLLVALKLAAGESADASLRTLAGELGLSKSSIASSLRRLGANGIVRAGGRRGRELNRLALRDCLQHAARWIAPATVGDFELGLPTAHSADVLAGKFSGDADPVVIPLPHGPVRGRAVSPLHPLAPRAASRDVKLYKLLTLVDAFRIGRARDREVAATELRACL